MATREVSYLVRDTLSNIVADHKAPITVDERWHYTAWLHTSAPSVRRAKVACWISRDSQPR